jgi:hypothetical protein
MDNQRSCIGGSKLKDEAAQTEKFEGIERCIVKTLSWSKRERQNIIVPPWPAAEPCRVFRVIGNSIASTINDIQYSVFNCAPFLTAAAATSLRMRSAPRAQIECSTGDSNAHMIALSWSVAKISNSRMQAYA